MPLIALLSCPANGNALAILRKCPSLQQALESATRQGDKLFIDVLSMLVVENVYGRKQALLPADVAVWIEAASVEVLSEADLGSPEYLGYLGTWNTGLLRWVRCISLKTGESVGLHYEHERGDTLYEMAWWTSCPNAGSGEVEKFGIQSNEGMPTPEWRKEAVRFEDGRIEVR
jgi:hypothetical protein